MSRLQKAVSKTAAYWPQILTAVVVFAIGFVVAIS